MFRLFRVAKSTLAGFGLGVLIPVVVMNLSTEPTGVGAFAAMAIIGAPMLATACGIAQFIFIICEES